MGQNATNNHRTGLTAQSTLTNLQENLTSTNGILNVSSSGGGGGGTQYAEGSTTSPATGTAMLGRYLSSPSGSLTNGQMSMPLMDNYGQLKVVPVGNISSNLTQINGNTVLTQANGLQLVAVNDGTSTVNIAANNSTGTGNAGNFLEVGGTGYTTGTLTLNVSTPSTAWFDLLNYSGISLEVLTNVGSVTLTFMTSGDASETNAQTMNLETSTGTNTSTTTSVVGTFFGSRTGRYFRINSNASGSNTATIVLTFYTNAPAFSSIGALQSGTWNVNASTNITSGTITTSSSSVTNSVQTGLGGFALVGVDGTYAGVSFNIQSSDNSAFANVPIYDATAMQWLAPGATITPGTNASKQYWVNISPGMSIIKVAATAYSSGTCNVRIQYGMTGMPPSLMSQIMDAAGNARGVNVTPGNALQSAPGPTSTAVLTSVVGANTSTSLLASNSARSGVYFYNDSTAILYLAFASSASTTAYTVQIGAQSFFEMPTNPVYTGAIFGIWASANGNVRITELS